MNTSRPSRRAKTSQGRRDSKPARPFVFINMAMTADGKINTASRFLASFGSKRDQRHLLELRAEADAVMAGARTVDSHPVTLGPGSARFRQRRVARGRAPYNLRIVASRSGSVNPRAEIFRHQFSPIIVLTTDRAARARVRALRNAGAIVRSFGGTEIDWPAALRWLRRGWKVNTLLCEGGGELNDALFRAGVVDELHLTICPWIFGGRTAPTISDGQGSSSLTAALPLALQSRRRHGDETFLRYRPIRSPRRE